MPPKRKSAAAPAAVGTPRKTRSMAVGKQRAEAPAKAAKKEAAAAAAPPEQKGRKRAKKEDAQVAAAAEKDSGAVVSDGKRIVVEAW